MQRGLWTAAQERSLQALSLPTSFCPLVEDFYSFAHAQQPTPSAPDRLPTRHPVVFACQESPHLGYGDEHASIGPATFGSLELNTQYLQGGGTKALGLHGLIRSVARQPLRVDQPHRHHPQYRQEILDPKPPLQLALFDSGSALERLMILFDPPPQRVARHDPLERPEPLAGQ